MTALVTERLELVPWSARLCQLALEDRPALAEAITARVPEEWPQADFGRILPMIRELAESVPGQDLPNFLTIHRQDRCLIGGIGFTRPPADGEGEFGYDVIPSYQRQGYATEMGRAVVSWAFRELGLSCVRATCQRDNLASVRVLEKIGLGRVEETADLVSWLLTRSEWRSS